MTAMRTSPLHDSLENLAPAWGVLNDMRTALNFPSSRTTIELCDVSALRRVGLKGPAAASWLGARGIPVPERPNTWLRVADGLIARLGRSEFLIEDGLTATTVRALRNELVSPTPNIYPVLRQDAALLLRGPALYELLAHTCSIDFRSIPPQERIVTLTMVAGVAVTAIDASLDDKPCCRIWCDGTYGTYLWDTLLEIAIELGGGPVGLAAVFPATPDALTVT